MNPFAYETTYGVAWSVMALVGLAVYAGIVLLMFKGQQWRARIEPPSFHKDI